jgi:hypothetical protein
MSEYICNLSLRARNPSEAYRIRDAIRDLVDGHDDCRVTGCGRSCIDPTLTDIEIRAKSRGVANRVVAAVRSIYASSCDIDAEMIV